MHYLMVTHDIKDYAVWRPGFDRHSSVREDFGCLSEQVFRDAENPNHITMLMEWDSFENAQCFFDKSNVQELHDLGVITQPTVTFLNAQ